LNPQQAEAVKEIEKHPLKIAGAGSGKTNSLKVIQSKTIELSENCELPKMQ